MWSSAAADHVQHSQLDCVCGGGSEHSLYNHPSIEIVLCDSFGHTQTYSLTFRPHLFSLNFCRMSLSHLHDLIFWITEM